MNYAGITWRYTKQRQWAHMRDSDQAVIGRDLGKARVGSRRTARRITRAYWSHTRPCCHHRINYGRYITTCLSSILSRAPLLLLFYLIASPLSTHSSERAMLQVLVPRRPGEGVFSNICTSIHFCYFFVFWQFSPSV